MHCSGLFFVLVFLSACLAQNNCQLEGTYTCSGGALQTLQFGGSSSSFFRFESSQNGCTLTQEGTWNSDPSDNIIETQLPQSGCTTSGTSPRCTCRTNFELTASNNCNTLSVDGSECTLGGAPNPPAASASRTPASNPPPAASASRTPASNPPPAASASRTRVAGGVSPVGPSASRTRAAPSASRSRFVAPSPTRTRGANPTNLNPAIDDDDSSSSTLFTMGAFLVTILLSILI